MQHAIAHDIGEGEDTELFVATTLRVKLRDRLFLDRDGTSKEVDRVRDSRVREEPFRAPRESERFDRCANCPRTRAKRDDEVQVARLVRFRRVERRGTSPAEHDRLAGARERCRDGEGDVDEG